MYRRHFIAPNPYIFVMTLAILFITFFALYYMQGIALSKVTGYNIEQNIFFGADHLEPFWGWVRHHKGDHPLLLLMEVPLTNLLATVFPRRLYCTLMVNAFWGSLGILLSFFFFRQLTQHLASSVLLTVLFGLSASQLLFSSLPESYSFSALAIIITYFLFLFTLQRGRIYPGLWVAAGVLTLGVVVTDFAQTLICFAIALFAVERERRKIYVLLQYIGAVFLVVLALNMLQKFLLGGQSMIDLRVYLYETTYLKPLVFSHPVLVAKEIFSNFFLLNIVFAFLHICRIFVNSPEPSFHNIG